VVDGGADAPSPSLPDNARAAQDSSVVGTYADKPARAPAPWRGRKRVAVARDRYVAVRCTEAEHAKMTKAAQRAGLSVGAFLRALACDGPGLRAARRPPIERQELARLLGHIGKLGSNVNQLAYAANAFNDMPSARELEQIGAEVREMRDAVMKALGRGD
jgi:hypothetical protein